MSILVVGSVAFDSVKTPFGERDRILGGSATYFSVAASFFTSVRVVAVVGEDGDHAHVVGLRQLVGVRDAVPDSRDIGHQIPVTYVPFRNAHFLSVAVSWAEVIGASKILIGAVEQDSSGYPDCRPAYYAAFNRVIEAGTKEGGIEVITPLIAMRKAQIVRLGLELGSPFDLTWSCYSREDRACGVCDSCALRLRAFQEAGAVDPLPYVAVPQVV